MAKVAKLQIRTPRNGPGSTRVWRTWSTAFRTSSAKVSILGQSSRAFSSSRTAARTWFTTKRTEDGSLDHVRFRFSRNATASKLARAANRHRLDCSARASSRARSGPPSGSFQ